jgi:hypothetical protein
MDKTQRYFLISQLRTDERWKAVVEELEYQEKQAFEALLNGASKEEVVGMVVSIRKVKGLPEMVASAIQRNGIEQ